MESEGHLESVAHQISQAKKELYLSGKHLRQVPDAVTSLTDIEVLDLSNNELTQLPDGLQNLTKLTTLWLSANKLSELPEFIEELKNLTTLDVAFNKLATMPGGIKNLEQLSTLILASNDFHELPKEICQLKMLVSLDINYNPVQSLPRETTNLKRLTTLSMAGISLEELPKEICCLKMLSTLDLSYNGLKQLPKNFSNLSCLNTLNLSINRFEEIPESVFLLERLSTLDISWNGLKKLSDKIKTLSQLTCLYVNGNNLFQLHENVGKLENLTTLDVSHNHLVLLPRTITSLTKLNALLLSSNRLFLLPNCVFKLETLVTLDAGYNKIKKLSERLAHLSELTTLQLPGNELTEIPKCVFKLKKLTTLNVSDNCITKVPQEIEDLDQLNTVNLGENFLQELPEGIFRLKGLTSLILKSNQLKRIQDDIINFHQLTTLDLSNNRLEELPQATFQLKALTSLLLSSNKLKRLHESVKNLEQLVSLELSDNCLQELPEGVGKLNSLVELKVTDNQLETLPLPLACLPNLKLLRVVGNPLQIPPVKVCEKGWPAIRAYLKIRKGEALHQKVVLLGSSGAGKTSLANTLAKNKPSCVEQKDRTIVLDKISWEIESGKELMDVCVIDFGGDDIYKIVHHLFLDENSLVLLVVNLQRYCEETYMRDLGSWINVLKTRVPKARVILVGTHLDRLDSEEEICARKKMVRDHLSLYSAEEGPADEQSNFRVEDFFTVSSKDYQGIQNLRLRILGIVAKNGKAIPTDWIDIYNSLQNMEETQDQPFLTFDTVKQLVENQENRFWDMIRSIFTSSEERTQTILAFFHDIGILLWYRQSTELMKFVFHRAEFLTEVMKVVFSGDLLDGSLAFKGNIRRCFTSHSFEQAKQDLVKRGVLSPTLLKALWKDHQIEETVFDAMVDLLIHLDLCYPLNSEGIEEGLLFPWFLQEDEPEDSCVQEFLHNKSPSSGCCRLSLKYLYPAMLPEPLFHNFLVRLHQHISDLKSRHDWKNGMYARVKKSCLLVHRSREAEESILTVSVEGTELMQIWSVLLACHHELTALMKQWPGLRWECWIICPFCMRVNFSEPGHFPQSNLEAKCPKGHVTCDRHKEMVPACLVYPLRQGQ